MIDYHATFKDISNSSWNELAGDRSPLNFGQPSISSLKIYGKFLVLFNIENTSRVSADLQNEARTNTSDKKFKNHIRLLRFDVHLTAVVTSSFASLSSHFSYNTQHT